MTATYEGYQILQTLGEGTFGKVKLARKNGELYAIKFSSRNNAYSSEVLNKIFLKESLIVSKLNHSNIVKLQQSFEKGTYIKNEMKQQIRSALVFEYMPYNLAEILELGSLDEVVARTLFKMILDGINYLHSQNIIHRDIKPNNLLFDQHFNVKICDFGLSTKIDPQNKPKTICGSDSFKSPQMLLKKSYNGVMNDLFAAGVSLFILVLGRAPFISATPNVGYYQFIAMNYFDKFWKVHQKKKNVSAEFKDLIISMLAFDPTHRISIPEIMAHPWMNQDILMGEDLQIEMLKKKQQLSKKKKLLLSKMQNKNLNCLQQQNLNKRGQKDQNYKLIKNKYYAEGEKLTDRFIPKVYSFEDLKKYFTKLEGQLLYQSQQIRFVRMLQNNQKIIIQIKIQDLTESDCLKFYLKEGHIIDYVDLLNDLDDLMMKE